MLGELGHDSETQREEQIANLGVRLLELVALAQRGDSLLSESHSLRPGAVSLIERGRHLSMREILKCRIAVAWSPCATLA